MARRYARDNRGRFASKGTGATARGGRLKTAGGSKRQTQTMQASAAPRAGAIRGKVKRDPNAASRVEQSGAKAKSTSRKDQLTQGAQRRRAQADKIDARVASLETQYRSKDSAFYTQGVKTAERDRMHGKMQQAAKLREESAALRQKASNADRMASKIKAPAPTKSSNNPRMQRAIQNETAGSTSFRRNPKGYQKRITALTAQKIYETGDITAGLSVANMAGKGFRLPRSQRKPAAAAAAKPRARKVDLSQGAFESRASATEKRARAAERAVQGLDRSNPQNRRAFNRADALRSAADSYSSLARRGRTGDLPASALFQGRFRGSTAPKLTRSQKAAATRQANKDRKLAEQIKAMERARRR
jgi:hypothetical protein